MRGPGSCCRWSGCHPGGASCLRQPWATGPGPGPGAGCGHAGGSGGSCHTCLGGPPASLCRDLAGGAGRMMRYGVSQCSASSGSVDSTTGLIGCPPCSGSCGWKPERDPSRPGLRLSFRPPAMPKQTASAAGTRGIPAPRPTTSATAGLLATAAPYGIQGSHDHAGRRTCRLAGQAELDRLRISRGMHGRNRSAGGTPFIALSTRPFKNLLQQSWLG